MNSTVRSLHFAAALLVIGLLAGTASADQTDTFSLLIENVKKAPTPSQTVAAYASGLAVDSKSVGLHEAYIRRMIDFDVVEMAYYQARLLLSLDAENGLGWGVIALMKARDDAMEEAFDAVERAAAKLPQDRFALNTAGQLLAWYDVQPNRSSLQQSIRLSAEKLRGLFSLEKAFVEGYALTKADLAAASAADREEAPKAEAKPAQIAAPEPAAREAVPKTVEYVSYESTSYDITPYYSLGVYFSTYSSYSLIGFPQLILAYPYYHRWHVNHLAFRKGGHGIRYGGLGIQVHRGYSGTELRQTAAGHRGDVISIRYSRGPVISSLPSRTWTNPPFDNQRDRHVTHRVAGGTIAGNGTAGRAVLDPIASGSISDVGSPSGRPAALVSPGQTFRQRRVAPPTAPTSPAARARFSARVGTVRRTGLPIVTPPRPVHAPRPVVRTSH